MNEIEEGIRLMEKGEIIVYPTDTLYAIGANVFIEEAVKKVYRVKKRPRSMPLPICLHDINEIENYAYLNEVAVRAIKKFLPGKLTIVLNKKDVIPDYISRKKVAIRVPDNRIALKISRKFPVTATSANIHGGEEPYTVEIARKQLGKNVAMYIDDGKLDGIPSTIVDVSDGEIKVIREGAVKEEKLYV